MQTRPAERQEPAIGGERQFGADLLVAAVVVGQHRFGARGYPLDRPADTARGPDDDGFFGIDLALHAETAAHVAGDDADAAFRDMQDLVGEALTHAMHVLRAGIEGVAPCPRIKVAYAAARLHRHRAQAVVEERQPRDVLRPGEGGLDRVGIAHAQRERDVVGGALVN